MTSWILASDLRVGDLVRLPESEGVSSWAYWTSREDAERAKHPFRAVERLEPGHDGRSVQVWREGGHYHILPREARVLRRV